MMDDVYWMKKGWVAGRLLQVLFVNFQFFRKCAKPEHSASLQPWAEAGLQTAGHLTPGDNDDDFICDRIKIKLRSGTWSSSSSPSSSTRCHTGTTPTGTSKSRIAFFLIIVKRDYGFSPKRMELDHCKVQGLGISQACLDVFLFILFEKRSFTFPITFANSFANTDTKTLQLKNLNTIQH